MPSRAQRIPPRRERATLRSRLVETRASPRRGYGRHYVQCPFATRSFGANRDRARHGPGSYRRLDAAQGRDRAEDGPEFALYCFDGARRQDLRELDGACRADKSEVTTQGRADSCGSRRIEYVCRRTRFASGGTRSARGTGYGEGGSEFARSEENSCEVRWECPPGTRICKEARGSAISRG
jgi:hypothetical protein